MLTDNNDAKTKEAQTDFEVPHLFGGAMHKNDFLAASVFLSPPGEGAGSWRGGVDSTKPGIAFARLRIAWYVEPTSTDDGRVMIEARLQARAAGPR